MPKIVDSRLKGNTRDDSIVLQYQLLTESATASNHTEDIEKGSKRKIVSMCSIHNCVGVLGPKLPFDYQ